MRRYIESSLPKLARLLQLKWLLLVFLAAIIGIGVVAAAYSLLVTARVSNVSLSDICLTTECVDWAKKEFSGSLSILLATGSITAWVATVGGILVALFSYVSSTKVSAFGNHVSHISIFSNYLVYEIAKRDRIASRSVDVYGLYTLIFMNSRRGRMTVSDAYIARLAAVSEVISASNATYNSPNGGKFNIRIHQAKLKKALAAVGISCEISHHRIDFHDVELQIFSLIDSINLVFCDDPRVKRLPDREYI